MSFIRNVKGGGAKSDGFALYYYDLLILAWRGVYVQSFGKAVVDGRRLCEEVFRWDGPLMIVAFFIQYRVVEKEKEKREKRKEKREN